MIPVRCRAVLPPGHWWIARHEHGRLIVTVSALVPPDSELEHELVRDAVRAWQHHKRRGLILAPSPIAGAGLAWAAQKVLRPQVAVGAAAVATGLALAAAVTFTEPPKLSPQRPPVAAAPPAKPAAPTPGHRTAPQPPVKSAPKRPGQSRQRAAQPVTVAAVSAHAVHVDPARIPVRLPVRVPPMHVTPPKVPDPPVTVTPPPVKAAGCRLVTLKLRVVRVCV